MTPWLTLVVVALAGGDGVVVAADIAAAEVGDVWVAEALVPLVARGRPAARVRVAAVERADDPISAAIDREVAALVVVRAGEGDRTSAATGRAVVVPAEIAPAEVGTVPLSVAGIVQESAAAIGLESAAIVPVAVIVRESVAVIALVLVAIVRGVVTVRESADALAAVIVPALVAIARAVEIVPELAIAPAEATDPASETGLAAVIGPETEIAPAAAIVPIGETTITSTTTSP